MDANVPLLNATCEPLNVVSVRRAIVLLLKEKAVVVEATGVALLLLGHGSAPHVWHKYLQGA